MQLTLHKNRVQKTKEKYLQQSKSGEQAPVTVPGNVLDTRQAANSRRASVRATTGPKLLRTRKVYDEPPTPGPWRTSSFSVNVAAGFYCFSTWMQYTINPNKDDKAHLT